MTEDDGEHLNRKEEETIHESELFAHITSNPQVFYKNQQINEPEISSIEKESILREVMDKSHCTFLSRFGLFMDEKHLRYFEQHEQTMAYSPDERYEIDHHLERIRRLKNGGRAIDVRNRRYAALQKLCSEGTYFSEHEMMQREPLLYDQLVGQFMTEREKRERDAHHVSDKSSIVSIIYNQMDKEQAKETLQKLEQEESRQDQDDTRSGLDVRQLVDSERPSRPNSPGFPRGQWGNFDDEEESRLETRLQERQKQRRRRKLAIPPPHLVTAGERSLLRDEFIGIMYARFIAGEDKEFDYTKVDDSLEYDDLDIREQDEQERYFDEDEEQEDTGVMTPSLPKECEESEDDLDVYMRHLNHHLEQQSRYDYAEAGRIFRDPSCEYDSDE
ncbi:coiled-coil domain-containing protein 97-like [Anopheles albimanus]|uniref:DUF2052 domain-containing protein n=1 Tax=Anopheles albimanus TaxID=7167 RepID=A0A182F4U5_ANOAL|nr:coiled-coil domain-containing protein 97-like [Anopheles albimanus]